VGQAYWPGYFETLREVLAPGGRACIQTIVIRDDLFDRYRRGTDFIQQYVFPGGMLPCPAALQQQVARAGLKIVGTLDFGPDYAHTLRHWRSAFLAQRDAVQAQGFDERFLRLWDFYLAYCEAAFDTGQTSVLQLTLAHA
jgi:cyclopropane-fatty-acyl-phospholipid synthase